MDEWHQNQLALFNKVKNAFLNFKKKGAANMTKGKAQARMDQLDKDLAKFREEHAEIIADDNVSKNHDYFKTNWLELIEDSYLDVLGDFNDFMESLKSKNTGVVVDSANSHASLEHSRLPKISIPEFSGKPEEWESFKALFTSLVIKSSMPNSAKLQHLLSLVKGSAAQRLKGLEITDTNFEVAWEKLVRRYDNSRIRLSKHLEGLMSLPVVRPHNLQDINDLLDRAEESVRALKDLECSVENYDVWLVHCLVRKLDTHTRENWEISQEAKEGFSKYTDLINFLERRAQSLEQARPAVSSSDSTASSNRGRDQRGKSKQVSANAVQCEEIKPQNVCPICKTNHPLYKCTKFGRMTQPERFELCKKEKLCLNCLQGSHFVSHCSSERRCAHCGRKHHTKLHASSLVTNKSNESQSHGAGATKSAEEPPKSGSSSGAGADAKAVSANLASTSGSVLLATARIVIANESGDSLTVRALIDPGAQRSFISESVIQSLGIPKARSEYSIVGLGGAAANAVSEASIVVRPSTGQLSFRVLAIVLSKLTRYVPACKTARAEWPHIVGLSLADPLFYKNDKIDCVLGADVYATIMLGGLIRGDESAPVAQNTIFGWILTGATSDSSQRTVNVLHASIEPSISSLLEKFWEVEEVNFSERPLSPEDAYCEQLFESSHYRTESGRYVVRLPFAKKPIFSDSRDIAVACLIRLENRLRKNPELAEAYSEFLREYLELGHMELVPIEERGKASYYFPHHAVVKQDNLKKIRVVFNASQKTSNGCSLNSFLLTGPKLQSDIVMIITNWRFFKAVFVTDIVKMFRQILVHPEDVDWQRIAWRTDPAHPIQDFRALTVTYGTASAPYLSQRVLQQLASDEYERFPEAAEIIRGRVYMDDAFGGADDVATALHRRDQLIGLLKSAGMSLGKWSANDAALIQGLDSLTESEIAVRVEESVSTLGLQWHPGSDCFYFKIKDRNLHNAWTKRMILAEISRLFDPLGWLAPTLVVAKIMLQDLWLVGSGWDEPVPKELEDRWRRFLSTLPELSVIRIPRWLGVTGEVAWQLHGFADASKRAYAAAVYVVVPGVSSTLLVAKSRVAPVKVQTLPRLELCGAHLLACLAKSILSSLQRPPTAVFFWTDSRVVLDWLSSHPSRWQTFVANRVSEIVTLHPQVKWRHVRSAHNPADCASRGISSERLTRHDLWWTGPDWLIEPESLWPKSGAATGEAEVSEDGERLREVSACAVAAAPTQSRACELLDSLEKMPSFSSVLRVLAYCWRWRSNSAKPKSERSLGILLPGEYARARVFCYRLIQQQYYAHEINCILQKKPILRGGPLTTLAPFIDDDGLMRVGGRLHHSRLQYGEKHPVILPGGCILVRRLVEEVHELTLHGGPQLMLSHLNRSIWVVRGRRVTQAVYRRCVKCLRYASVSAQQQMAPLPAVRLHPQRPFAVTGVDYAGPIPILFSKGRGAKTTKGYIAIFICLVVRAVHIEVVSDLTTEAFLAAYARFTARRGCCSTIYSDNGTNFQGAARELKRLFTESSDFVKEISNQLSPQGTSWTFIPPRAPHFGGLWEAAVRSFKYHLRRALGEATLTFEELSTLAAKIEACLNSRPLCPISVDALEDVALTPGHFLIGSALLSHPEPYDENKDVHRLSDRWQRITSIRNVFWSRWRKEVLHHLQQRNKWLNISTNFQPGDVVLIKDELTPPARWPLARIVHVHPGKDGLVRVVTLQTAKSTFIRPIVKLIRLPTEPETEDFFKNNIQKTVSK